jgi:tetratricopeptide (TPR) repeat protein
MPARVVAPFSSRLFLFILLFSALTMAQTGGGTGGSGGSTGGTGGGTTGGTSGTTGGTRTNNTGSLCAPNSANCGNRERRPVFLSGQVIMDDGSPVPNNVSLERICSGQPVKEAHTDSHGYFSFQVGRNLEMMNDASSRLSPSIRNGMTGMGDTGNPLDEMNGGMPMSIGGETSLAGCELRASLAGYRSSSVNLSDHHALDNPDVGVIVLQRLDKAAGTTMSITAYKAPKDAKKAFESGVQALKKRDEAKATAEFQKAVSIYPAHAEAWVQLGNLLRRQGDSKGALNAYQQASQSDTRFVPPYLAMAEMAVVAANWADVAKLTKQALDLDPLDYPGAYFLNAVANYNIRNLDAAEAAIKRGQRLDSQHRFARLDLLMSNIFIARQDYPNALQSMRTYLKNAPNAEDAAQVRQKIAELEPLAQKRQ